MHEPRVNSNIDLRLAATLAGNRMSGFRDSDASLLASAKLPAVPIAMVVRKADVWSLKRKSRGVSIELVLRHRSCVIHRVGRCAEEIVLLDGAFD
jgi:hypothetical protein